VGDKKEKIVPAMGEEGGRVGKKLHVCRGKMADWEGKQAMKGEVHTDSKKITCHRRRSRKKKKGPWGKGTGIVGGVGRNPKSSLKARRPPEEKRQKKKRCGGRSQRKEKKAVRGSAQSSCE